MATAFHLFQCLPREIQAMIWDAAVRPVPGERFVHRFAMRDNYFNLSNPPYPLRGSLLRLNAPDLPNDGFLLAIPWDDADGNANDSVYILDSSLWVACSDSRAAMERRFKKNEWWSGVEVQSQAKRSAGQGHHLGEPDASHSASFIDGRGRRRHITIAPNKDLLYLDARYMDMFDWFHHYAGGFMPLFDLRHTGDPKPKPSFLGGNVGIDYDPTMLDTLVGRCIHYCRRDLGMSSMSIIDMVEKLHDQALRTIWFIDHRFQPIDPSTAVAAAPKTADEESSSQSVPEPTPKPDQAREVFRSSKAIFTEVKREDIGTRWAIVDVPETNRGDRSPFEFFDHLFQEANGRLNIDASERLRVLACQAAPGETHRALQPFANNKEAVCAVCNPVDTAVRGAGVDWSAMLAWEDPDLGDWHLFESN